MVFVQGFALRLLASRPQGASRAKTLRRAILLLQNGEPSSKVIYHSHIS